MKRRFAVLRRMGWAAFLASKPGDVDGGPGVACGLGLGPAAGHLTHGATSATRPQIVLDPKGNAVAVWRRGGAIGTDVTVQSAFRPVGGPWQAPVDLSRPAPDETQPVLDLPGPRIAVDAQGNAVAVWQRFNGASLVVQAAERPSGGAWRAPVDISGAGIGGDDSRIPRGRWDLAPPDHRLRP